MQAVSMVAGEVPEERAAELRAAYEALVAGPRPDGLLETSLLRDGAEWLVVTRWRDRAALRAMRATTARPAAIALFEDLGAHPRFAVYDVVVSG